jgi:chemotaxis protein MotB
MIPEDINWILRVDGHTDVTPVSSESIFADNWELSQARSLSVVKYMIDKQNIDPNRLYAAGFGEHQPISFLNSKEGLAKNRRIEFKLTER